MTTLSLRSTSVSDGLSASRGVHRIMDWAAAGSLRRWLARRQHHWLPASELAQLVAAAGFLYEPDQDIIYSRKDAWQRALGYCYAYDKYALATGFVIDCEPIFFRHDGKDWMIELWKGQYGLETGCEVGVYNRRDDDNSPDLQALDATIGRREDAAGNRDPLHSRFYKCADEADSLQIAFRLVRNGSEMFARGPERHWWLTGFRWGVLSRPEELRMDVSIAFPDLEMCDAFAASLRAMGYADVVVAASTVSFVFATPRTYQPRFGWGTMQEVALASDRAIVDAYCQLGLPSNDPNLALGTVGAKVEALASSFLDKERSFMASALPQILEHVADEIADRVRDFFDSL